MSTVNDEIKKGYAVEIDLLLSHILGKTKEFLFMNPNRGLTASETRRLLQMVKRRQKGEPIAYILGYKDFMGLRFKVNKSVLIPRPETEAIIERLKDLSFKDYKQPVRILDVGTGSGCIAVTIAKQLKGLKIEIIASDISKKALTVAKQNAKNLLPLTSSPLPPNFAKASMGRRGRGIKGEGVKIKFIQSDLLEKIKFVPDIIVANLPYGWKEWKNNTTAETVGLKFEPKEALFTKEKGLFEIHRLLNQIAKLLSLPKVIFLEFDPRQKSDLKNLIKKILPNSAINFHKDLRGFWRFVEIIPK